MGGPFIAVFSADATDRTCAGRVSANRRALAAQRAGAAAVVLPLGADSSTGALLGSDDVDPLVTIPVISVAENDALVLATQEKIYLGK